MKDLTKLKTYIIDSSDPNEVDDAFSLELLDDNLMKLWIHISNPCKLFLLDSKIDYEAKKKNNSLYLIDEFIPMLPEEIIKEANLEQNKISETISGSIIFNNDGSIKKYEIVEALIKPKYQLTYEDAEEIIQLEPREENEIIIIKDLLLKSANYRKNQGAIIIDMPTNKIILNNNNIEIIKIEKNIAQIIVSESMILMGFISSLYLTNNRIPAPFRTQNINCNAKDILEKYKESQIKYSILKQYMGKSYITTTAKNHESLGLINYTQCTSPLRRYLDLVVQRQIYNHINNYELLNINDINQIIDFSKRRQIENNNIYKNNKLKFLNLFFINENKKYYKIIFIKWINYKKNIALVFFPDYSLEILIILYVSIEIYINKIYKVKYNINDNNLLEFIY